MFFHSGIKLKLLFVKLFKSNISWKVNLNWHIISQEQRFIVIDCICAVVCTDVKYILQRFNLIRILVHFMFSKICGFLLGRNYQVFFNKYYIPTILKYVHGYMFCISTWKSFILINNKQIIVFFFIYCYNTELKRKGRKVS